MTIEVREMIIKAIVTDEAPRNERQDMDRLHILTERMKSEILADCREMLMEMLSEQENR